ARRELELSFDHGLLVAGRGQPEGELLELDGHLGGSACAGGLRRSVEHLRAGRICAGGRQRKMPGALLQADLARSQLAMEVSSGRLRKGRVERRTIQGMSEI